MELLIALGPAPSLAISIPENDTTVHPNAQTNDVDSSPRLTPTSHCLSLQNICRTQPLSAPSATDGVSAPSPLACRTVWPPHRSPFHLGSLPSVCQMLLLLNHKSNFDMSHPCRSPPVTRRLPEKDPRACPACRWNMQDPNLFADPHPRPLPRPLLPSRHFVFSVSLTHIRLFPAPGPLNVPLPVLGCSSPGVSTGPVPCLVRPLIHVSDFQPI